MTIINIYAPNEDDPSFFMKVSAIVAKESKGIIIFGGDFNCVLDLKQDKSPPDHGILSKRSKAAKYLMEELGLIDLWRTFNPQTKDFTFYSNVHRTYPRIDMICISKHDLHRITDVKIEPITLSDHGPVRVSLNLHKDKHFRYWRLNVSI